MIDVIPRFKTTEEYLEFHSKRSGKFHTRYMNIKQPHPWIVYNSKEYKEIYTVQLLQEKPHHREVLSTEVVIDVDVDDKKEMNIVTDMITARLCAFETKFSLWETGGKGVHFHTYWKGLDKYTSDDRKILKELILKHLCFGVMQRGRIDTQLCSTHMIRAEHGQHEATRHYKSFLKGHNELEYNEIPEVVIKQFEAFKERMSHWKPCKIVDKSMPICVQFFLSDDFIAVKDGRKNALFALSSWYKQQGLSNNENIEKLIKFDHYNLHGYLGKHRINAAVRSNKGLMRCSGRHKILQMIGKGDIADKCCEARRKENDEREGRKD